jgi:hypothetical protein
MGKHSERAMRHARKRHRRRASTIALAVSNDRHTSTPVRTSGVAWACFYVAALWGIAEAILIFF